ncbi:hypothetical protein [Planococcus lenghuensis]|uniref:Uncharacterized protein n=1 Tax=Planococcus lenghuensis TaxID=2213202 RepID=A0A1Q2KYX4_9BACL|nr:hypothetical protein [Planococcus lenghuensis]AQQ53314.1 hypothetical protein B0X71_09645 [Planococcus lenghuensis]
MEIIAEQRRLEQHVIGGSFVYAAYHVLGFLPFFDGFSLFELNGLLIHLAYFPVFMAISFVSYLLLQKRFPGWALAFLSLIFVKALIQRLSALGKWALAGLPLLFVAGIFGVLIAGS